MATAYTRTGMLTDGRTVALDEAVPLEAGPVRLVVEPIAEPKGPRPFGEVLAEIHERQRLRGHRPPTREQVDEWIRAERESWED